MLWFFSGKRKAARQAAQSLYATCMERARQIWFYRACGVPDTWEGRFEVLSAHVGQIVTRLCRPDMGREGPILAQALFDVMFRDIDRSLREMGIGDMGVPHRVKKMMKSFKGRAFAYDEAIKSGESELKYALMRNMYHELNEHDEAKLTKMTEYMLSCARKVKDQGLSDFWQGHVEFPTIQSDSEKDNDSQKAA